MRNWILKKLNYIIFLVIIAGVSVFALMINSAETMSEFSPPAKQEYQNAPEFQDFRKSIKLRFASGEFDPVIQAEPDVPTTETLTPKYPERQERFYIIQFAGPIKDEQKYELENLGIRIFDYLPDFAFIVKMDDKKRASAQALKGVRWIGSYQPAYRIEPTITRALSAGEISTGAEYVVTLFKAEDPRRIAPLIEQLGAEVLDISSHASRTKITVRMQAQNIEFVTAISGVKWIEPAPIWKLTNNVAAGIMDVYDVWNTHNLYGAGQTVAVADSGLDQGSTLPANLHDDFEDGNSVSRVSEIFDRVGDGADDVWSGHGTHVAGSVLGNGARSGSDPAAGDYTNSNSFIGMAPQATLVFQALENNSTGSIDDGIPSDLNILFSQAYGAGARIHTNSWGASEAGNYTSASEDVDQFVWNNKDFLILFSAGNDGVDADGDGFIDPTSMGSPATAKNCITVGASENDRFNNPTPTPALNNTWGWAWPSDYPADPINTDHVSDDENGIAAFSSRGPCLDGRFKPDLVAPGTNVVSTKSSLATDLWGSGGLGGLGLQDHYIFSGGTSMSAPLVAGAATLVRNFFTDLEGITPSAALIKATLLNGAFDMSPGQYGTGATQEIPDPPRPSNVAGWGRVNLENSIFPASPRVMIYEDEAGGLATNEIIAYDLTVNDDSEPLKANLVWSDFPGSPAAGGGLVNDLDFSIVGPSGTVYYPNNANQSEETQLISYDDGLADGGYIWTAGNRVGVRFTPTSYPVKLDKAIFLLASNLYPNTFSYYVYSGNDAAGPQQVLASGTTTVYSSGWHSVDLSPLPLEITSGDFFLAIELNADLAWFYDSTMPQGRSWDYTNGTWTQWPNNNYMFRAVVVSRESVTSYDRINNVVGIDIQSPAAGDYKLYVEGYNVPQGPQPYALVLSGGDLAGLNKRFPPTSPGDVIASAVSSTRIELTWSDRSDDEDGFKIEKKIGAGGTYSEIDTVGANVTDYVETGQADETSYYYRVRAYNAQGDSSYFNESNVMTHAPPSDLLAAAVSDSRISLSWSDNSSNESGYEILRRVAGNPNYSPVGTVAANGTSYADSKLSASTIYDYLVRAVSANSGSNFSNAASATTLKPSGGGGGGCFIAVSAYSTAVTEKIIVALVTLGCVCIALGGLQKRLRKSPMRLKEFFTRI